MTLSLCSRFGSTVLGEVRQLVLRLGEQPLHRAATPLNPSVTPERRKTEVNN